MRAIALCIGLLFTSPSIAFLPSETNEYEVAKSGVWAEFRDDAGAYPLQCRLDPQSVIRVIKVENGYVYARLLVSAAWDLSDTLISSVRGACRNPFHFNLRIQQKKAEEWEGDKLRYKKQ